MGCRRRKKLWSRRRFASSSSPPGPCGRHGSDPLVQLVLSLNVVHALESCRELDWYPRGMGQKTDIASRVGERSGGDTRSLPLYMKVAERIAVEVIGADLHKGDRLPSERSLCAGLGVSRVTLRSALKQLSSRGVISSEPARGWFVQDDGLATHQPATDHRILGFSDAATASGKSASATVLNSGLRPASIDEAEQLGLVAGAQLFELTRIRFVDGVVIAVDQSRVPGALHPGIEQVDYSFNSLYAALRSGPEPVIATSAEYAVEAAPATPKESRLLEVADGTPLLVATQITRDQHGRVFELGRTAYRGDRYRFRATLGFLGGVHRRPN